MDLESIVKRCQSGDRDAFEIIYRMYLTPMHDIVSYYINTQDAVWDILHDGFIIAFQSIESLKKASKIKSWLTTIMKNLALQYLKEEANHISVPMPDAVIADDYENTSKASELTWEELDNMISKLPEGYGKIFRLAVLDGLSHKDIGALLGIAPHSSSSQLTHAKAMLRSMILQYRVDMGALTIIVIALLLWYALIRLPEENLLPPIIISKKPNGETFVISDTRSEVGVNPGHTVIMQKIQSTMPRQLKSEPIGDKTEPDDGILDIEKDSACNDTVMRIIGPTLGGVYFVEDKLPKKQSQEKSDWSLSLECSGSLEQQEVDRYRIPNPYMPDGESLDNEIEVTEKVNHHIPWVISILVNRAVDSRWSIETGIRYTFMRSDILSESKMMNKEIAQHVHYVGIPLKFNYHLINYNGFSLYGQGGGALDIPVFSIHHNREFLPESNMPNIYSRRIKAPLQWSVEGGLGIQYHFTSSFSIYAEPSLRYWFNSGSDIKTIREDQPVEFSLPIGLRLTW